MTLTKKEINDKYINKKRDKRIKDNFILDENEIYKVILDNERYYITNQGRVFSTITCSFLKPNINNKGYKTFCLSNRKRYTLHRLLGIHFIDNPFNYPVIDHIDRNKLNNELTNLRWTTISENNINRNKGSIHKRKDVKCGKIYEYYRVYYYTDNIKKSKSFKNHDEALLFYNLKRQN
jgi:hypothetical protein